MRPLLDDQILLVSQSLQKGPVPPSGGSPCSTVPRGGSGICNLNAKKIAAFVHAPPAFPTHVVEVGVALTS